jgi:hypothetical protein
MMFQIPLKLETARLWFGPVALLFARYSPLRGCSSQTPSHRAKLLRDQLPPSTLIGTAGFLTEGNEMNEGADVKAGRPESPERKIAKETKATKR